MEPNPEASAFAEQIANAPARVLPGERRLVGGAMVQVSSTGNLAMVGIEAELRERWLGFPGVVVAETGNAGSRVIERSDGEHEAVLVFEDSLDGEVAALVTEHFVSGRASWVRRAGPVRRELVASDGGPASVCLVAGDAPMRMLVRNFGYASARMHARRDRHAEDANPDDLDAAATLPALLSHALVAFTREYGEAPAAGVPSLPVWANVLRAVAQGGTEAELRERAIVSRRVLRVVLRELSERGWLGVEDPTPGKRGKARVPKRIHLTRQGLAMARAGRERIAAVESRWEQRFGAEVVGCLRDALAGIAACQELELPHYLVGYGIADASLTGGSYLPAEPGPPRKPARGEEWPVVPRDANAAPSLTLPALLSWALTAFTLDYEAHEQGSLAWASVFLRRVPDTGMPLGQARRLCDVVGNGRSGPERHLCVVVTPGKPSDASRTVYLTPKSKHVRDAWPWLVREVEREWDERFGTAVARLRHALEAMDAEAWAGLPDYPDTTAWALTAHLRAQGQAETLPDQRDTGSGVNLAWHAGQRRITTRD